MRKIEQAMIKAIKDQRAGWQSGNTSVECALGACEVRLHGNSIARITEDAVCVTLAGWPTPTTRSRLNAILREFIPGGHVYQSEHCQYVAVLGGGAFDLDPNQWFRLARGD